MHHSAGKKNVFFFVCVQVREHYSRWWKSKVAASEFLSNYFGEMAEYSLSRQLVSAMSQVHEWGDFSLASTWLFPLHE